METQGEPPLSPTKRRPASGRVGDSPSRKRRVVDFGLVRLRSPAKRSMNELNKLALKLAYEKKLSGADELEEQEMSLADKIIQESKLEVNIKPFGLELDLNNNVFKSGGGMSESSSPVKEPVKAETRKTRRTVKREEESHEFKPEMPFGTPAKSPPKKRASPFKTPQGTPRKSALSPLKSELYSIPTKDNRSMSLTDRLNQVAQEESPMASPLGTPRRRNRTKDMSEVFDKVEDIKPTNYAFIPLMEIPDKDDENDILLTIDKESKKQSVHIDGFDGYFEQIRLRSRPSLNTMSMAPLITYDEYHKYNAILDNLCIKPMDSLNYFYERQSAQWLFEIQEGFNLAFYGIGSKMDLINSFVQRVVLPRAENTKCIVVNGYNPEFHPKILFKEIWQRCFRKSAPASRELLDLCKNTIHEFSQHDLKYNRDLILVIHNIDGASLRNDKYQYILSELVKLEKVTLICTMDNVNTPLLWDTSAMTSFNFIWHNISTFASYQKEVSFKDPLSLGKTDQFVGSMGAKYVLISLNTNAKRLYQQLLIQQLEMIDMAIAEDPQLADGRSLMKGSAKSCLSLKEFYDVCSTQFIATNIISFRSVLGEFVEHKMCRLVHDRAGTEILFVPFTVEEMEKILTEELGDLN